MDTLIYVRLLITHIYSMEYTIRSASARKSVSQASSTTRSFPYCRRGIAKNGNNVGQNIVDRECSSLVNILYVLAVHESAYLASKARNNACSVSRLSMYRDPGSGEETLEIESH